jgi:uncharacterized caspase-like protein
MFSRILGIAALVAVLFTISGQAAVAEKRVALIIGNSTYKSVTPLPNPARDAVSVADMFKKAGFDVVESKLNLSNADMRRAIREFTSTARNADIAVVYYAGHGIEFDGVNYLIPVDAQLATDVDVEDETVSLDRIIRMLDPVKRLRLVMLDACRENPFARKMTRTVASRSVGRGLAQVEVTSTDTLVAFAAKAGMTAADGDGDHSPFTTAVLDNLTTPGLDLRIAFGKVRDEVMKNTDRKQEPFVYGSIGGATVALVPKKEEPVAKSLAPAPAPASSAADTLARDYEFAERVGTREAWESFLSAHSTGFFANLARAAINKITAAEQRLTLGKDKAAEEDLKRKAAEAAKLRDSEEARLKAETDAKKFAAEEAKLKARLELLAKEQQAQKTVIASAPSASPEQPIQGATRGIDPTDIASLLQFHLKRVGCDPGALDGKWTDKSAEAMEKFNKHEKTNFDVKVASLGAVDAVRGQKGRVCPLVCPRGEHAQGSECVANEAPHKQVAKPRSASQSPPPNPGSRFELGCSGAAAMGGSRTGC